MMGALSSLVGMLFRKLNDRYLALEASGLKTRSELQVQTCAR